MQKLESEFIEDISTIETAAGPVDCVVFKNGFILTISKDAIIAHRGLEFLTGEYGTMLVSFERGTDEVTQ